MPKIEKLTAREILDSRGNPTVEVELNFIGGQAVRAAVPSGASTGAHEAHELRDKDPKRYNGKGVLNAIKNITEDISKKICGVEFESFHELDQALLELDATPNKSHLGANSILGVSLAFAKAQAKQKNIWLFELFDSNQNIKLPVPLMNILNGGAHANNGLDVQEFMIVPLCDSFSESLRAGCEVFHSLKTLLNKKGMSTAVGDEGGFAPDLSSNQQALDFILQAIEQAGYKAGTDIFLALDVASTELFETNSYTWENKKLSADQLGEVYQKWKNEYPLISIEDAFAEDDWDGWIQFQKKCGDQLQLVGDDLFVTHPQRIQKGIDEEAANALLVKVNQIGTLSETQKAIELAHSAGFKTVMSHRSGETEDTTIADLAVGLGCQQIKTGSLSRGERTAKYNQLLRIEEFLGKKASYWGRQAFRAL